MSYDAILVALQENDSGNCLSSKTGERKKLIGESSVKRLLHVIYPLKFRDFSEK